MIVDNVKQVVDGSTTQPIFKYFGFDTAASPPTATKALASPLSVNDKDLVVRVEVEFDAQPVRNPGGQSARSALDTRFENGVFVRTADPLQPARDPAACV